MAESPIDIAIVGGGIAGLTTAYYLAQSPAKLSIMVTEMGERWGGSISSRQQGAWLWEEGPNSFSPNQPLLDLIAHLGINDRLLWADAKLPRFVWWGDRLQAVPTSPPALLSSELLSGWGKLRALVGALGFVRPPMAGQESVADFFRRHLGQEVLDRLVAPFVSGVYAGDPHQLEIASAFKKAWQMEQLGGGLLAGFLAARPRPNKTNGQPSPKIKLGQLGSFPKGLQELPDTIAHKLLAQNVPMRLGWRLALVDYDPSAKIYSLTYQTSTGTQVIHTAKVVLTIPAYACAEALQKISPLASTALTQITYPPVACVALGYPQSALKKPLVGFGNLIPRGQGIRTLGTIWSSSLFPNRAPKDHQLLLNFIGGTTDPAISDLSADAIAQAVDQDLRQTLLHGSAPAPEVLAVKLWEQAIPQYDLTHPDKMTTLQEQLKAYPHLYIGGNFTDGVALGDCVRRGRAIAKQCLP